MGQILEKLSAPSNKNRVETSVPSSTIKIPRIEAPIDSGSSDQSPFRFLFIGETGAGKSSTIANLFQLVRPTQSQGTDFIQIWTRGKSLEVIELPGLLETGALEDDAPAMAAFLIFLRNYFSAAVPTLIFVTARDSDNRFEGCSSNFSQVLQAVKLILSEISDSKYSNVILLLSNGRGADIEQEIDLRISRYQAAFKEVIPIEKDVPCLAILKDSAVDDFKQILQNKKVDFSPIKEFLEYLNGPEGAISVEFGHEEKTLKDFKTDDEFRSIQRKIMNCIISGVFSDIDFFTSEDSVVENKTADSEKEMVPFCINSPIEPWQAFEPVFKNTKILMANGSRRSIDMCRVGDKVTSLSHKRGIITGISKMVITPELVEVNKLIPYVKRQTDANVMYKNIRESVRKSRLFSNSDSEQVNDTNISTLKEVRPTMTQTLIKRKVIGKEKLKWFWTHDESTDRFALVPLTQCVEKMSLDCVYFIQIDNGCGTFVADDIVRACSET